MGVFSGFPIGVDVDCDDDNYVDCDDDNDDMDDDCDDDMEIFNHDQVDGQEIPTDGCSAQLSSHQILLSGGRACPTCAFVYDSNTGVFLKVF